jgi:signal transduction histidine kinase
MSRVRNDTKAAVRPGLPEDKPTPASGRTKVWIVDDSPLQAEMCRRALALDHEVVVYNNGGTMLEALHSGDAPDVLVIDWFMPSMSGLEICRFVRAGANGSELPILIVTASEGAEELVEGLGAGANDYVRKPFAAAELNARVATLVRTRQLHAKLVETKRELNVEAEFRERFIAVLAHDLRQPLSVFMMTNHLLAPQDTSADVRAMAAGLQARAADRMKRMISELLDFTRSRPKDGMPIERRSMDFADVAQAIVEEMRVIHPTRALGLHVDQVKGDCRGSWDADRIAQIFTNLITNAIEYSPSSSPIDMVLRGAPEGVELEVTNTGPAIPKELIATLFDPFRRSSRPPRSSGGLGLGLYIVDQIVRAHTGNIVVESDAKTTRFIVRLPKMAPSVAAPGSSRAS